MKQTRSNAVERLMSRQKDKYVTVTVTGSKTFYKLLLHMYKYANIGKCMKVQQQSSAEDVGFPQGFVTSSSDSSRNL